MFQLGKTIVSEDILDEEFVCNLHACKGLCCVEGEAGAPVLPDERRILEDIYPVIRPLLLPQGVRAIAEQGVYTQNHKGEYETPLVEKGGACAYVIYDDEGIAGCAIEKAYNENLIDFQKPLSCHLYPVRVTEYKSMTAVNYHVWSICSDACRLGRELRAPVYTFVKAALIRKFGEKWFEQLDEIAKEYYRNKKQIKGE